MKKRLLAMLVVLCWLCGAAQAQEHRLIFYGDWDRIQDNAYQAAMREVFETTYPRLVARWGMGEAPDTILFGADASDADTVAYSYSDRVVIGVDYANRMPTDLGCFVHELTHCVQAYGDKIAYGGDAWWTENMANYSRFRYYHWTDETRMQPSSASPGSWMDWGYDPYGNAEWFFAYMDSRYPTLLNEQGELTYGLIDSIHRLIRANEGEALDDDPYDPSTPINRLVYDLTGYDCIESLRMRFAQELAAGSWSFTGFADYADRFITENLPGVPNPEYPTRTPHRAITAQAMEAVTQGDNLFADAAIGMVSGFVNDNEQPGMLIDGNFHTKWCSTPSSVTDTTYCRDGALQWIVIDLGEKKAFNTYTIINTQASEPSQSNMVSWELLISDDGENWTSVDYQPYCNRNEVSFDIGNQQARYVLLAALDPDDGAMGTIRLYEMLLFQQ